MLHNGLEVDYSVHKRDLPLVCSRISSSCILKCKHMTRAISTLKKSFPLDTKTQDYHLAYLIVLF